jgi:DNA-binding CsgD family transcriptional regulator
MEARDDLARVGGAVLPTTELTPTEQRIAQLVVEGMKNREVADAMFISVKTVEANLSRIFHKLGVRIVAAMVSAMVGGAVAVAGRTMASEPGVNELGLPAPWIDPSCRELIALPKREWVCESHRPEPTRVAASRCRERMADFAGPNGVDARERPR